LKRFELKQDKQAKKCKADHGADLQQPSDVIAKEILCETDYYFEDGNICVKMHIHIDVNLFCFYLL